MQRNSGARFFPMLITIVIIVLIIVAIVSIGRALFGGDSGTADVEADRGRTELLKTDSDHSVSLTVRGPIVADENFKSYQILVSPDSRSMEVYSGYLDETERSKTLNNSTEAYEEFVYALDKADMMKGTEPRDENLNDLRGVCATGYVYEYAVLVNDEPVKHLWTSTCGGSKGTLNASITQLNDLFFDQIPDSENLIPFKSTGFRLQY